jgi:hypothetical protein
MKLKTVFFLAGWGAITPSLAGVAPSPDEVGTFYCPTPDKSRQACWQWTCGWGSDPKKCGWAGLLYPDGVEPGDPAMCEAPAGNKCHWVWSEAPSGGDGSFERPYNGFEAVAGYVDNQGGYVTGRIRGGDFLYVRGVFKASAHVEGVHNTSVELARVSQSGTPDRPTVIKSWRGHPRAVFDGEYRRLDLVTVRGLSTSVFDAVRIQNVEVTRAQGRGVNINEWVLNADIAGVFVHDGMGDGILGTGGGILLRQTNALHRHTVRNSVFYGNRRNQNGGDNNVGGISILSESSAETGSTVELFGNLISDEVNAVRHKHSGNVRTHAYANVISSSTNAFYLRAYADNDLHHNVIQNVDTVFQCVAENQNGDFRGRFYNNTVVGSRGLVDTGFNTTAFLRAIELHDNIFLNLPAGDAVLSLGRFSSNVFSLNGWSSGGNLYHVNPSVPGFLYHQGTPRSFTQAGPYLQDDSSFMGDPLLRDSSREDFRLRSGSPAIGRARNGGDLGAFPWESESIEFLSRPRRLRISGTGGL